MAIDDTIRGDLRVLTLNRPDKANALTREMLQSLCDHVVGHDDSCPLILTGAGRVFSAGADLDAARAGLATDPVWEELSAAIAARQCLTIAALNGTVAGGAVGMALACDLRIAVPHAMVFYPVMKHGFLPQPSDVMRLKALTGPAATRLVLLGGAKLAASEALRLGIFDRICEVESLLDEVTALTADALAAGPIHSAAIKRMI